MAAKKKTQVVAPSQADPRAPLDAAAFLSAAQRVLAILRDDLLTRVDESPGVTDALKAQWQVEKEAKRTGDPWEVWRRRVVVQVAAAWVLSLVFARTLEDRGLLERNRIAGPGATDSQEQFRGIAPYLSDRDYLLTVFGELSNLPAAKDLFDPAHNPVWKLGPSIAGARALLDLFRAPDPEAPAFRFGQADTHFLGDLYQGLDEETRERFALLQTPPFVEAYILDRTLERAITRFGLDDTTLIDPTCGSGHFLLGAFERLLDHRLRKEPGLEAREAARRALDAVYGADINPYAVSIARFRLTLAFLERGGYARLAEAPALSLRVVVGDSLLHAPSQAHLGDVAGTSKPAWGGREFALEDEDAAKDVLLRRYAAVVGNPPYITVKDSVLRERYREMYPRSAAGKYSLGAPFTERFFLLARASGFVGMITANSFMKREFGKKLIEGFLPTVNVDGIVNTSGAYIPGHGTPTVLLFGANEPKHGSDVLTVLAKRGEPSTPDEPARGFVWSSIADHGDDVGFDNDYITVARVLRTTLENHPWSLGGGGASELKELIEERATAALGDIADSIGIASFTLEDDVFLQPQDAWLRLGVPLDRVRPMAIGEAIRDWSITEVPWAFFPYDHRLEALPPDDSALRVLWPYRSSLANNKLFGGKTKIEGGLRWYEYGRLTTDKLRTPLTITFAFVATHNHFVLERGGKIFNRSAPIIKLKKEATEEDHLALLGYLNSSVALFWMRQVFSPKGMHNGSESNATPFLVRFEFDGTKLQKLPLPRDILRFAPLAAELDRVAHARAQETFADVVAGKSDIPEGFAAILEKRVHMRAREIALQEEIDWLAYELFDIVDDAHVSSPSAIEPIVDGERPFEIALGKDEKADRAWFRWNATSPAASVPARLSSVQRLSAQSRIADIGRVNELRLLETPECKRRWVQPSGKAAQELQTDRRTLLDEALTWVNDSVERVVAAFEGPQTQRSILEAALRSERLSEVVGWLTSQGEGVSAGVKTSLLTCSSPYLAAYRYTESGFEKRTAWETTWATQRREGASAYASAPPKYDPDDYREQSTWRLRGKLDFPKERFISYPGCESDEDREPVYGWAGWNHLQRAIGLATLYLKRKQGEAWGKQRLVPMLAGLEELLPWIWQWHPDPTPESGGMKPGQYIADFLSAQCQELGVTVDDVRAWRPESKKNGTGAARKTRTPKKSKASTEEETP